jgi:hypothetical protein
MGLFGTARRLPSTGQARADRNIGQAQLSRALAVESERMRAKFAKADKAKKGLLPVAIVAAETARLHKPPFGIDPRHIDALIKAHADPNSGRVRYTPFAAAIATTTARDVLSKPKPPAPLPGVHLTRAQTKQKQQMPGSPHRFDVSPRRGVPYGRTKPNFPRGMARLGKPRGAEDAALDATGCTADDERLVAEELDLMEYMGGAGGRPPPPPDNDLSVTCGSIPEDLVAAAEPEPNVTSPYSPRSPQLVVTASSLATFRSEDERIVNEELNRMARSGFIPSSGLTRSG